MLLRLLLLLLELLLDIEVIGDSGSGGEAVVGSIVDDRLRKRMNDL